MHHAPGRDAVQKTQMIGSYLDPNKKGPLNTR
jgi:hypothetical protein